MMSENLEQSQKDKRKIDLNTLLHITYLLFALSFFNGITAIIGVVLLYIKRDDAEGTLYASHFEWLIRTFWLGLLGFFLGLVGLIVMVGILILFATTVWMIYRVAKGWLMLYEGRSVIAKGQFF